MARFNLNLPDEQLAAVQAEAEASSEMVTEVFRRFIRIGLALSAIEREPGTEVIIRRGKQEQRVILL